MISIWTEPPKEIVAAAPRLRTIIIKDRVGQGEDCARGQRELRRYAAGVVQVRYKVIDTISYSKGLIDRYPELAYRGEGVLAILELSQIKLAPDIRGLAVMIHKPNGETSRLVATESWARHSVVGIFFKDVSAEEVRAARSLNGEGGIEPCR